MDCDPSFRNISDFLRLLSASECPSPSGLTADSCLISHEDRLEAVIQLATALRTAVLSAVSQSHSHLTYSDSNRRYTLCRDFLGRTVSNCTLPSASYCAFSPASRPRAETPPHHSSPISISFPLDGRRSTCAESPVCSSSSTTVPASCSEGPVSSSGR